MDRAEFFFDDAEVELINGKRGSYQGATRNTHKIIRSKFGILIPVVFCFASLWADDGIYVSLGSGVNFQTDSEITSDAGQSASFDYDSGYALNVALGYAYKAYRFELEALATNNGVDGIRLGSDSADASGHVKTYSQFFNVCYDYPVSDLWTFSAGIGFGLMRIVLDNVTNRQTDIMIADGTDGTTAYQVKMGFAFRVREHLLLTLDGRYVGSGKVSYEDLASSQPFEIENNSQSSLEIGLRYYFAFEE